MEKTEEINESLRLTFDTDGLSFGTDAYLLSAYLRGKSEGRAAELGAGTGVVSLLCLSRNTFSAISCVEIQPKYGDLIRRNAEENGFSDRISVLVRDLRTITAADCGGEADAVFANPPYLRPNSGVASRESIREIARRETYGDISDFCGAASRLLRWGGYFTVVYRPDRTQELFASLERSGLTPKRMTAVYATEEHPASLILVEAKKGASAGLYLTPPLILERDGKQTDVCRQIYETGGFDERYYHP